MIVVLKRGAEQDKREQLINWLKNQGLGVALIFEPVDKLLALVLFCATLEYDDHNNFLLIDREISPQRKNAAQV